MAEFGNDWALIFKKYGHLMPERSTVSLKDRARSMRRILERANQPLGVWASASKRDS